MTNAAVTPKEDQLKINEEDKGDIWTRVSKPTRDRGKRKIYTGSTSDVNCMNEFEALRVLNDSTVAPDRGPIWIN